MSEAIPAAVLAAGRISDELAQATGASCKALIEVGGAPIIDRILEAVRGAASVGETRVVCAEGSPLMEHVGAPGVITRGPGFVDSVRTGLEALGNPERMLIITGDLPFLTPASLDHFCGQALQSGASIVYCIVRREDSERVFPGGTRTYVRLTDGVFTGGNVAVVSREFVLDQGERLSQAFSRRKSPLHLGAMFGWAFIVRLVIGRLSLADVVARGESMLGADLHVVQSPHPEIGFDVDKPANLQAAEAWREG